MNFENCNFQYLPQETQLYYFLKDEHHRNVTNVKIGIIKDN